MRESDETPNATALAARQLNAMLRQGVRTLATSALKAAEPSPYTISVSTAQGIAKGLTGGMRRRTVC